MEVSQITENMKKLNKSQRASLREINHGLPVKHLRVDSYSWTSAVSVYFISGKMARHVELGPRGRIEDMHEVVI